jgi:hypothetical protein
MRAPRESNDWISVSDAAEIAGYTEEHIRRLIRQKHVEACKYVTVWQVSRKSLLKYIRYAALLGDRRGPKEDLDNSL